MSTESPAAPLTRRGKNPAAAATVFLGLLSLCLALAVLYWVKVLDADVLLHLRTGDWIMRNRQLPAEDPFSTSASGRWITHEWLWQVLASKVYEAGKWPALFMLRLALVAMALAGAVFAGRQAAGTWRSGLAAGVLLVGPMAVVAEIRPQLATASFFSLTFALMLARRWRLASGMLPVLFLVWANLHGAVLLGFVLLGLGLLWELFLLKRQTGGANYSRRAALTLVLCVIAASVNPNHVGLFTFPLKVVGHETFRTQIYEWARPDFGRVFWPFWALVGISFLAVLVSWRRLPLYALVCYGLFAVSAVLSRRQIPFFCIACAPVLAAGAEVVLASFGPRNRFLAPALMGLLALAIPASGWCYRYGGREIGLGLHRNRFPEFAAGRLANIDVQASLLNDYNDGGYLIWKLWPTWRVTMDGRADLYGPDVVQQYQAAWLGRPGWQETLRRWQVRGILSRYEVTQASPHHNLHHELARSGEWFPVLFDDTSVLYLDSEALQAARQLKPFRRLHPGLRWPEIAGLQQTPADWTELGADIRRAVTESPDSTRAASLLKRYERDENRPSSTR